MHAQQKKLMKANYRRENTSTSCNCLCWGQCCLFLWILSAIWFIFTYYTFEQDLANNYITEHDCIDKDETEYDVCCVNTKKNDMYTKESCEEMEYVEWLFCGIELMQLLTSLIGVIALARINTCGLCFPIIWTTAVVLYLAFTAVKYPSTVEIILIKAPHAILVIIILCVNFRSVLCLFVSFCLFLCVFFFCLLLFVRYFLVVICFVICHHGTHTRQIAHLQYL